jgi:putative Holliday junction resolvase
MRFMGLDVGDKRIGIALSDEQGQIAMPKETLHCEGRDKDTSRLAEMVARESVGEILVGMPISLDGTHGPQAQKVTKFVKALSERVEIPVVPWDERLSTVSAERVLIEGNVSRARRRKVIDKVAATFILQSYLDFRNKKQAEEQRGV